MRRRHRPLAAAITTGLIAVLATGGCAASAAARPQAAHRPVTATRATSPGATTSPGTGASGSGTSASGTGSSRASRSVSRPLAGKKIGIDPGHNGRNRDDPSYINRLIWNGREMETCDTTGTETDAGYTEARFNFRVARDLRADLRRKGARVVLTRHSDSGVGPCVNRRARILDHAHVAVAIDIHADGGPASGRGFTVLEPVADAENHKVIRSSDRFGRDVHHALLKHTRMPVSDYYGHDGYIKRDDLAGLNLATQPKILIESGNMRNATDARLLTATWFQKRLARAFTDAIVRFLTRHRP